MTIRLLDLDFGKDTAEFDRNLADYFVATAAYSRILSGNKSVVTGRKGSGKTALMNYFVASSSEDQAVITLEASQATLLKIKQSVDNLGSELSDLDASFKHAWLFSIMLALSERVMERKLALSQDAQLVYQFAREHLAYSAPDTVSAIANYVIKWFVNAKSIGIGDVKIERDTSPVKSNIVFDERVLLRLIESSARELQRRNKTTFLFFDKLDERWEASSANIALVQGLLIAVRQIKALNLPLFPVVLVRDDIFRAATKGFQHIDHFRMELEAITWDESSLVALLAKRIQYSLTRNSYPLGHGASDQDMWNFVFEESVPFKKTPIPMTAWLIERTLARPRDLVLLANMALEAAVSSGSNGAPITKDHVKSVERKFSEQKLDDLIAELSVEWPGAETLFEAFRRQPSTFSADQLTKMCEDLLTHPELRLSWLPSSVTDLKTWLYRVGFMCFTKSGGSLRGTRVIHSGIEHEPGEFLSSAKVFVSPIFRSALQMRDRQSLGNTPAPAADTDEDQCH